MLYLVAAWVGLLAVVVPAGAAILRWTGGSGAFDRPGDRAILSAWLGALLLANVLLVASFLFPLSPGSVPSSGWASPSRLCCGAALVTLAGAVVLIILLLRTEEILMVTLACLSLIPLAGRERGKLAFPGRLPKPGLAALLVAVAAAAALKTLASPTAGRSPQLEPLGWLTPPDRPTTVRIQATNGVPYRVPRDHRNLATRPRSERSGLCWAAELPCTGHPVETDVALPDVVLRDPRSV